MHVYCNRIVKTIYLLPSYFAHQVISLDIRYPNNAEPTLQEVATYLASTRDSPGAICVQECDKTYANVQDIQKAPLKTIFNPRLILYILPKLCIRKNHFADTYEKYLLKKIYMSALGVRDISICTINNPRI